MLWQDFTEICILRAVQMWSPDAVIVSSAITLHLRSCRILNAILSLAVSCLSTSHITVLLEIVMFRIFLLICYWSYLKARNTLLLDQVGKLELNNNYANLNLFFYGFSVSRGGTSKTSFIWWGCLMFKERTASLYRCYRNAACIIFLLSANRQRVGL